jgi:hypothetical protein
MEAGMIERFEQRRVKLADINCGGEAGWAFIRRAGETAATMRKRLVAQERIQDGSAGKIAAYERRMAAGDRFPPIFIFEWCGEYWLDDGWHRCAAAALQGRKAVSGIVIKVASDKEVDNVSTLLYDLEEAGAPWQARVRAVADHLSGRVTN